MAVAFPLADRVFAAVLFDLDGTLIDSTAMVQRSWAAWAAEYGVQDAQRWIRHGVPARAIVESMAAAGVLDGYGVDEAMARIEQIEVSAASDGIPVLPGAARALSAIAPERAAIVTSCTAPLAEARIRAAQLRPPAVVVTADQLGRGKPDPEGFLRAASALGVDPSQCLVVEDAPAGLAAGRAAGCSLLALTTTTVAAELSADAFVSSLDEVDFVSSADGVRVLLVRQ